MTRDDVLNVRLSEKVYVVNKLKEVQEKSVVQLVYRGDEIRIIYADSMKNWATSYVMSYKDVFLTRQEAKEDIRKELLIKLMDIQKELKTVEDQY